jgi:hypothetical protein
MIMPLSLFSLEDVDPLDNVNASTNYCNIIYHFSSALFS